MFRLYSISRRQYVRVSVVDKRNVVSHSASVVADAYSPFFGTGCLSGCRSAIYRAFADDIRLQNRILAKASVRNGLSESHQNSRVNLVRRVAESSHA